MLKPLVDVHGVCVFVTTVMLESIVQALQLLKGFSDVLVFKKRWEDLVADLKEPLGSPRTFFVRVLAAFFLTDGVNLIVAIEPHFVEFLHHHLVT